ncbi:MAG: WD40 repeat domain-containing protein [Candidatus Eremiobacteraeota bacterium]|nr:WD40 repeat domain-containing protein [Candidatus Eremiobacteraeota bacterium]MCW5870145.1 WD40 repeat domain-containing protein [Candidatus Eremiobacteraeota bacterium]
MSERLVIRAGHPYTQDLAFRPDGLILATVGTQQAGLHFWEVRGARPLGVWHGHPRLQGLRLSQDRLLTWGEGRACLWDSTPLHQGSLDFHLLKDYTGIGDGSQLGARQFLLSGTTTRLGSSRSGKVLLELPGERWCHLGPRGRRLVVGNRLVSGVSGRIVHQFETVCAQAAFSPEERWLAVCGYSDSFLTLMDLERTQSYHHAAHSQRILQLRFSPDGLYLASLCEKGGLTVVDLESGHSHCLETQLEGVSALGWLGADRLMVGDGSGSYRLVEVAPEGLRASTVVPGPLVTESGTGRWLLGPDGLAAWTLGAHLGIRHLATGQTLGHLPAPLRSEPRVRQQLVGQTVLVEGIPWDLRRGKAQPGGPLAALGQVLVARRGQEYQIGEGTVPIPAEVPQLRAVCGRLRSFAFTDRGGQRLEIWRRDADHWSRWRTAPALPGAPHDLQFSSNGQLLSWHDGQGGSTVWIPESNRLYPCSGPTLLLPQGWLEADASGAVQVRDGQGNLRRQVPGSTGWCWLLYSSSTGVVLVAPRRAEAWNLELDSLRGAWELPGLVGASLSEDGKALLGIEASGDISLWSVPQGRSLGPSQPFHPQDLPHLQITSGHGLALACAGRECGCWRLDDGSFEWIRFGEPWFSGVYPLPEQRVLLLTQDGSWHLYGGRPLHRLATLSTAENDGFLVIGDGGRWDSSPELYSKVLLDSGRQAPAPEDELWQSLISLPTSRLEADRATSPDPA